MLVQNSSYRKFGSSPSGALLGHPRRNSSVFWCSRLLGWHSLIIVMVGIKGARDSDECQGPIVDVTRTSTPKSPLPATHISDASALNADQYWLLPQSCFRCNTPIPRRLDRSGLALSLGAYFSIYSYLGRRRGDRLASYRYARIRVSTPLKSTPH